MIEGGTEGAAFSFVAWTLTPEFELCFAPQVVRHEGTETGFGAPFDKLSVTYLDSRP